jgi:cephalosporin-C deacetylase
MPLTFDLPIEQLKTYLGKNPCPFDFDSFWDRSLAEMRSIDPEIELIAAEFTAPNVECFHLFFSGVGGARVHANLLRPTNASSPHPALLMFHGYTGDLRDWFDKLGYASGGFTFASLDCRGHSGLSDDRGSIAGNTLHGQILRGLNDALQESSEKLLVRQIFLDTTQLARIV